MKSQKSGAGTGGNKTSKKTKVNKTSKLTGTKVNKKEHYPFGKLYEVELEGVTPLMHHKMTEEQILGLISGVKGGKKKPKGEFTPRQIAEQHAYMGTDGTYQIPLTYVSGAFRDVSGDYKQKDSARKSYKSIACGIFRPIGEYATLLDCKNKPLKSFEVDIRKATNHQKGAVAVCRPRFDAWKIKFNVMVDDSIIAPEIANSILVDSGRRSGLGSFRVNKSGYFGQFIVTKWKESTQKLG